MKPYPPDEEEHWPQQACEQLIKINHRQLQWLVQHIHEFGFEFGLMLIHERLPTLPPESCALPVSQSLKEHHFKLIMDFKVRE